MTISTKYVTSKEHSVLSEQEKEKVQKLLSGWNLGFLIQTCIDEYQYHSIIA